MKLVLRRRKLFVIGDLLNTLRVLVYILAIYGSVSLLRKLFLKDGMRKFYKLSWYTPVEHALEKPVSHDQRVVHIVENNRNVDHCVFYNFLSRTNRQHNLKYEPISLSLHSTINYANHIIKQAETWDDLISYAVFIIPGHEAALPLLSKLHHCHNLTRSKVSVHLVWMRGLFQRECAVDTTLASIESVFKQRVSCDNFSLDAVIEKLQHFKIGFTNYPINIMRNEARRGAPTKLHLVGDIETQWSTGFAKKTRNLTKKLLNNDYGNAVLVYRRFEQDSNSEFPTDIETFAKLVRERKIVQFHQKFFRSGHIIPNLDMWISYSLNRDKVLLKNLSYGHHEWEPQFIMRHDAPYHYEHTPTRYLDHQFLCYELCRAGYSFLLMTHVFNIHPGIKSQNSLYERAVDAYGRAHSYPILKKYGDYLNSEYPVEPEAGRRCPKWKDFL